MTRSLSSTVSPSANIPLTEETLRIHDESKGFTSNTQYTPPSESRFVSFTFYVIEKIVCR